MNAVALKETKSKDRTAVRSQRNLGRVTGVLYLVIIVAGMFAQFFVRSTLIVPDDAAATATNIIASEAFFRAGIAADLVMILADVAIGLLFYVLLKHVNQTLALLAAFFRLAQAATLGINLLIVLPLLSGAAYLSAFEPKQLHALALPFLNAHGTGYSLALVFFACSIFVLGYLLYKSGTFPRILGILLLVASLGYAADGFARVLLVNYADYQPIFDNVVLIPAFVAELALCLWLLVKGAQTPARDVDVAPGQA